MEKSFWGKNLEKDNLTRITINPTRQQQNAEDMVEVQEKNSNSSTSTCPDHPPELRKNYQ